MLAGIGLIPQPVSAEDNFDAQSAIVNTFANNAPADLIAALSGVGGHGLDQVGTEVGGAGGPNPEGTPPARIGAGTVEQTVYLQSLAFAGDQIGQIQPGVSFDVLKEEAGWYLVRLADQSEGWVLASLVTLQPEVVGAPTPPAVLTPDGLATPIPPTEIPTLNLPELPIPDPTAKYIATRDAEGNILESFGQGRYDQTPRWKYSKDRQRWTDLHEGRTQYEGALPGGDARLLFERFGNQIVGWNERMNAFERDDGLFFYPKLGTGLDFTESDLTEGWTRNSEHLVSDDFVLNVSGVEMIINVSIENRDFSGIVFNPLLESENKQQFLQALLGQVPGLRGRRVVVNLTARDTTRNNDYYRGDGGVGSYVIDAYSTGFTIAGSTFLSNISVNTRFNGEPRSLNTIGQQVAMGIVQNCRWMTSSSKPAPDIQRDFSEGDLIFEGERLNNNQLSGWDRFVPMFVAVK